MSKILTTLLLTLWLSVGAAWAGDVEDADAAFRRNDYATALAKYKIAALKKDAYAQLQVGNMYDEGLGVIPDYAEAVRWYKMAAVQGDARAQNNLGLMYNMGKVLYKTTLKQCVGINWLQRKEMCQRRQISDTCTTMVKVSYKTTHEHTCGLTWLL